MKKIILLTAFSFIITACSSTNTNITQQAKIASLQESYTLSQAASSTELSAEEVEISAYFEKVFNEALQKANIKMDQLNHDTIIEYGVTFDEGNKALRYLVGFGAGAATATIKINVTTKNNQESILSLTSEASMSIGVFGGDAKSVLDNAAQSIVEELLKSNIFKTN